MVPTPPAVSICFCIRVVSRLAITRSKGDGDFRASRDIHQAWPLPVPSLLGPPDIRERPQFVVPNLIDLFGRKMSILKYTKKWEPAPETCTISIAAISHT